MTLCYLYLRSLHGSTQTWNLSLFIFIFIIMGTLISLQYEMLTLHSCRCSKSYHLLWVHTPTIVPLYSLSPLVREDSVSLISET